MDSHGLLVTKKLEKHKVVIALLSIKNITYTIMKKTYFILITFILIYLFHGCVDDTPSCRIETVPFDDLLTPLAITLENNDTIKFKRDQRNQTDTIEFILGDFQNNDIVLDFCPETKYTFARKSFKYTNTQSDQILIDFVSTIGTNMLNVFVEDQLLYGDPTPENITINLETGVFKDCMLLKNIVKYYGSPGSDHLFHSDGRVNYKLNTQSWDSDAYYNQSYGVVNITLYKDTDSTLTYQRIL